MKTTYPLCKKCSHYFTVKYLQGFGSAIIHLYIKAHIPFLESRIRVSKPRRCAFCVLKDSIDCFPFRIYSNLTNACLERYQVNLSVPATYPTLIFLTSLAEPFSFLFNIHDECELFQYPHSRLLEKYLFVHKQHG